jgi:anti-anti-sigma factor
MPDSGPPLHIRTIADVTLVLFRESAIIEAALVERLGAELYRLVDQQHCRKLILDFTKVRFLASGAVGVVIALQKRMAAAKGRLVICGLRQELKRVFQLLKVEKLFSFCADEAQALGVFGLTPPQPETPRT